VIGVPDLSIPGGQFWRGIAGSAQCRDDRNTVSLDLRDGIRRMKRPDNNNGDHNDNDSSKAAIVVGILRRRSNTFEQVLDGFATDVR
jgi:hypothetical protein